MKIENNELKIPEYTKDDYLTTSEPFDFVYKYKDNKFKMQQIAALVSAQAKSVGVRNFLTLWKSYWAAQASANGIAMDGVTNFADQPLELATGDWVADDYGVSTVNKYGDELIACNHPIMPVQRLVNIDTDAEKLVIAYKKRGRSWRKIPVEKTVLSSANKIVALSEYGIAVNSENAKHLVRYFTDVEGLNQDKIPEINSVSRLGWISDNEFSPYAGNLIFDGDLSFKHFFESVKSKGNYEKWLDVCRDIRSYSEIGKIVLAASFGSALVKPCSTLPFFVHIWGGTEAGKTVALMLAASVWANPEMGAYIHTFNSTAVGLELSASFVNSMPLIIDELQILGDRKDFDRMIYQLSEGIGRSRGAKSGGLQKLNTWQNCIITTGEMPITNSYSAGGAVNRILEIDCADQKVFKNPVEVVDTVKKNHGFAGCEFVEKVKCNIEQVSQLRKKIYAELQENGNATEKQLMAASVILTADKLIDEWIFHDGNTIPYEDITKYLSTKNETSANVRALEYLYDYIAINQSKFSDGDYERYGKIDADYTYFIKSKFDEIMRGQGFSPAAFLSWADRQGILRTKQGRKTINCRVNGAVSNCVCIKNKQNDVCDFVQIDDFELDL